MPGAMPSLQLANILSHQYQHPSLTTQTITKKNQTKVEQRRKFKQMNLARAHARKYLLPH